MGSTKVLPLTLKQKISRRNRQRKQRTRTDEILVPQPPPNEKTASRYNNVYKNYLRSIREAVKADIVPILRASKEQFNPKTIADSVEPYVIGQLERAFSSIRRKLLANLRPEALIIAKDYVGKVNEDNEKGFARSLKSVDIPAIILNEGLTGPLMASVTTNVNFIVDVPNELLTKIEGIVYRGVTQGTTTGSLITDLQKAYNFSNNRAKLIARDQTTKINSMITEQRQTNLGIEEYVWRTVQDEAVRPEHARKNGKIFRWDRPPKDTGHPGHDIQCRCRAEGILKIPAR